MRVAICPSLTLTSPGLDVERRGLGTSLRANPSLKAPEFRSGSSRRGNLPVTAQCRASLSLSSPPHPARENCSISSSGPDPSWQPGFLCPGRKLISAQEPSLWFLSGRNFHPKFGAMGEGRWSRGSSLGSEVGYQQDKDRERPLLMSLHPHIPRQRRAPGTGFSVQLSSLELPPLELRGVSHIPAPGWERLGGQVCSPWSLCPRENTLWLADRSSPVGTGRRVFVFVEGSIQVGEPDLANNRTGHPVKSEFQV